MLETFDIVTFVWLGFWALFAVKSLASGSRHSVLFVILVHFVFCGVPLLLDLVIGEPIYSIQQGFRLAARDGVTGSVYCLYVAFCPLVWWWTGRARFRKPEGSAEPESARYLLPFFYLFLVSPLLALVFAPRPHLYLNYSAVTRHLLTFEARDFHGIVVLACRMSLLGAAGLLLACRPRMGILPLLYLLPWFILAIWLEGTRNLVVIAVVLLFFIFWHKGHLRQMRFYVVSLLLVFIIAVYSYSYQLVIKSSQRGLDTFEAIYRNVRIDYGRDDVIKMAIFAELYPEKMRILEKRGQSLIFYATIYVPRRVWPEKPWTYAVYVTSAMLGIPARWLGWGVTTSWLDEALANFGWFGFLIGPLLISWVCRVGDGCRNAYIRLLTVMVGVLLLSVHLVAFAPIALFWAALVIVNRWPRWRRRLPAGVRRYQTGAGRGG